MTMNEIEPLHEPEILPAPREGPYLIVGLGNPGWEFECNRHNVGFMCLNRLAGKLDESYSKVQSRALVCKSVYRGEKLILAKPQTFMNASGGPVSSLVRFYKVPLSYLLVIYDDVDLPLGTLRIRPGGGSAGQKGMESIIDRLGREDYPRLRIGTGRPPGRKEAADYVLQDFPTQELDLLNATLDRAVEAILTFVEGGLDKAMNSFNG